MTKNQADLISRENAQEFTESLAQHVGASWRQVALAKRMGVPRALGMSTEDWVAQRLGGYVRMAVEDRREAVAELKAEGYSNREAAAVLGVDHQTIANDLRGENSPPGSEDTRDVATGSGENSPPPGAELNDIGILAASAEEKAAAAEKTAHVSNNSGENEWYTPPALIAAARQAMGTIDVDPASSEIANKAVGAARYFTATENGLVQKWAGAVWLNPPYAQPLIAQFAETLVRKFAAREVLQACVLVNNATDTAWFRMLAEASTASCFTSGRVRFLDPEGNPGAPLQGQSILYFGPNAGAFAAAFCSFGYVYVGRPVGFAA